MLTESLNTPTTEPTVTEESVTIKPSKVKPVTLSDLKTLPDFLDSHNRLDGVNWLITYSINNSLVDKLPLLVVKFENDLVKKQLSLVYYETQGSCTMKGFNSLIKEQPFKTAITYYKRNGDVSSVQTFWNCEVVKCSMSTAYDTTPPTPVKVYVKIKYTSLR